MVFDDFVSANSAPLYRTENGTSKSIYLLWGDGVEVLAPGPARTKVRARRRDLTGFIDNSALGGTSLLEVYIIDVGQGDGVLIKTPDFKHIMLDGGYPRKAQNTRKSAADFVDWKFYHDYKQEDVRLDAMIASHCDADHYGGLWDALNATEDDELDVSSVKVKAFYHAGIGRWKKPTGASGNWLGPHEEMDGDNYFTQLMGDRDQVLASLDGVSEPQLQGWWGQFLRTVTETRWTDNTPTRIARLSAEDGYLPGFDSSGNGKPAVRVLAPLVFDINGKPGIRRFTGGDAQNTNGNSLLLRLDYGRARILLTGDLNKKSMGALLQDYAGQRQEFACDVAKACHHGSDDISLAFLRAMQPAVTVISSGDNEKHDHPRPSIVAALGITGYFQEHNDELVSPLVYSTELARSISLGHPFELDVIDNTGHLVNRLAGADFLRTKIRFKETKPGDLNPKTKTRRMRHTKVVAGTIYGLVNIRTDGDRILCAILNEKNRTWQVQEVYSRF